MFARLTSGFALRSSAVVLAAWCSAAGCSAPPGTDTGDDDVPEFGAFTPPGSSNPGTLPPPSAGNDDNGSVPPANGAGGSTSAPSNEQIGNDGIGLDPAPSGSQSGAQNAGAGGSSMASVDPNTNTGAAGSSFDPGTSGNAGSTSVPPSDPPSGEQPQQPPPQEPPPQQPPAEPPPPAAPPPSGNCNGAFFCDGFESVASGASPTAAVWQVISGYNLVEASADVQVSNANARSGTQALRVAATGGRTGVIARLPQSSYFVRAFFMADAVPLGPVFIGLGTDQNSETRLRIQGQSFATINTFGPGDAVHPDAANSGNCQDCVRLAPNQWFCAEMFIDEATRNAVLWIDGVEAASVVNGQGGWPVQPENPRLFLGSMSVQGGSTGVWIDDVAAGPERIGCN